MDKGEVNIALSSLKIELSRYLSEILEQTQIKSIELLKKIGAELKRQWVFLIHFKYTQENIKAHLLQRAADFFGYDFDQDKPRRKRRSKPSRKKSRLNGKRFSTTKKNKKAVVLMQEKWGSRFTIRKKVKKRHNFYEAPCE